MGTKRIIAKSEQDLEGIMSDVKKWFEETPTFDVEITSEKRKFRDPKTREDFEKDIDVINIIDQTKKDKKKIETTIKFIPLIKAGEMKVEIGGDNESTVIGKIKNQLKNRGVLKSYTKDTKVPLKETISKSTLINIIREEIQEILLEENKLEKYYKQILELIRKASKDLNDDEAYELHEKLKTWFNKLT